MVSIKDKSKGTYKYNCDICGKEVSYEENTLKQLHVKYERNKTKKICELCKDCYKRILHKIKVMRKMCKNESENV